MTVRLQRPFAPCPVGVLAAIIPDPSHGGAAARQEPELRETDAIAVERVTKSFQIRGVRITALDGLDLSVPRRSVVAVVGPNGSGKSTLLRLIGGLLQPDAGEILIEGGRPDVTDGRIGICFQEPRLLPWRDVLGNVALPLELRGMPRREREEKARESIEMVGITGFERARPHQLSGGMRQRAAVARALVRRPSVLLLDEPFSALDALTRERLDVELLRVWQETGTTIVLVTHDIPEAVFLADRVVVLSPRPGRVVAEIPIDLARPRDLATLDGAAFAAAAASVRAHLSATVTRLEGAAA